MVPRMAVLETMIERGLGELKRSTTGLLLSAFSAGLDIGFGPLLMAVTLGLTAGGYGDLGTEMLLASAYAIGFILVILGRSELFTEHTALAVMPVLDGQASPRQLGRLWGIVWLGNVLGGMAFAALIAVLLPSAGAATPGIYEVIATVLTHQTTTELLVGGILAGWLMGLLAWMLAGSEHTIGRIVLIWAVTGTIGLLHLPHSIAGNVEVLLGMFTTTAVTVTDYLRFLVVATVGNAVGGGVFVALLKYGHVSRDE